MKYKSSILVGILCAFFAYKFVLPKTMNPEPPTKEQLIVSSVLSVINQGHFQPKAIDDNFSKAVFKTFLERLDGSKRYFTASDYNSFKVYENAIDEQIKAQSLEFFDLVLKIYDQRMIQTKTYYTSAINVKHDFNKKETIELDGEKLSYAKDEKELQDRWRKLIKYEIVSKAESKLRAEENNKELKSKSSKEDLLEKSTVEVKKNFDDWFVRLNLLRRSDRFETYVSSITNYFDPHTEFFNPKEKQDFDINMGNKVIGIGARLSQDGEYVKVSDIVVGGPAWKGKELEVDDLITVVTQKGGQPLDITGMRLDDVVSKIRGEEGSTVILKVKKKNGIIKDITIIREEVILEEGLAKSAIIDVNAELTNVGYIYLPRFYSSFEDGGNSCAVDVAKEIEKLKKEDVNGIILDLRNNSGGSLSDVVTMSGLFIESGPIVQVKGRETRPYVNVDKDKEVQYAGPLIVLVNHFSASASEIIAAAVQDYGRGVIVGSPTFGKGSVQRFYDLDRLVNGFEDMKPLGSLKMTMQKFYRVNGGSTQHKGVIPDIEIPDTYKYMNYGEKEYDYALEYTEIAPQPFKQNVVKLENLDKVKEMSNQRINSKNEFQLIEEIAKKTKKNSEITQYPISFTEFNNMMVAREKEDEKYKNLMKDEVANLGVKNLKVDDQELKASQDEGKRTRNAEWVKGLKKDIYLEEAMLIMRDMIKSEASFAASAKGLSPAVIKTN